MASYKEILFLSRTLSAQEKRQFQQFAERSGKKPDYWIMYKEVMREIEKNAEANEDSAEPQFDEARIQRRLTLAGILPKHHGDLRRYLYDALLQSLRQQPEKGAEFEILNLLYEAKLLHRRSLLELALDRYSAAQKQAEEYGYQSLAVEAIKGIIVIESQMDIKDYQVHLFKQLDNLERNIEEQKEDALAFAQHFRAFILVRTRKNPLDPTEKATIEALRQHILPIKDVSSLRFLVQIYPNATLACLAILDKDIKAAKQYFRIAITHPGWTDSRKTEHLRLYIIYLSNYLSICLKLGAFEEAKHPLQELEAIIPSNLDDEAEYYQNLVFLKQFLYLNTGEFGKAAELEPEIERILKKYANKVNKARERTLRYHMMLMRFAQGDYDKAFEQIKSILELRRSSHRLDLQAIAKIFRLMIWFEKNDHLNWDTQVKAVMQNLSYNKNFDNFEDIILFHFGKLAKLREQNLPSSREKKREKQIFENFKAKLEALQQKLQSPPLGFNEILLWVQSKIEPDKSFLNLLLKKKSWKLSIAQKKYPKHRPPRRLRPEGEPKTVLH